MLEVHLRKRCTAFQVRKAFLNSPTRDWSGSAGAVYPAIKRLELDDLIVRSPQVDGRGTHTLLATEKGVAALHRWAAEPSLASAIGADPFRTRVDYLKSLPIEQRTVALAAIKAELTSALTKMDQLVELDHPFKGGANDLASQLLRSRMDWINNL